MKYLLLIATIILVVFGVQLFFGNCSVIALFKLKHVLKDERKELEKLEKANMELKNTITHLRISSRSIEELARYELGMIKNGEIYFQVIEKIE